MLYGDWRVQLFGDAQEKIAWHSAYWASSYNGLSCCFFDGSVFNLTVGDPVFQGLGLAIWHDFDTRGGVDVGVTK